MTKPKNGEGAEALLGCPFCGGEANANGSIRYSKNHEAWWSDGSRVRDAFFVNCVTCGIDNKGFIGHQAKAEAIAAWNRRAPPATPVRGGGNQELSVSQSQPGYDGERAASAGAEPSALFSPGPWSAHPSEPGQDGKPLFWYVVRGDHPYDPSIANTWPGSVNHQGDARLISAAPDMLAALENALPRLAHTFSCHSTRPASEWAEHGSVSFEGCDCAIKLVRAAVAKAIGREAASPLGGPTLTLDELKSVPVGGDGEGSENASLRRTLPGARTNAEPAAEGEP